MQTDRILALAKRLLTLPIDDTRRDLWIAEHAERVMHHALAIADLPQHAATATHREALVTAALFHDAGWVVEFQQGRWDRWQLLTRPTSDIQRDLGAAMMLEEVTSIIDPAVARRAADAIRECNHRNTSLHEARLLAEAEALDEVSVMYILRQFRQYQAEGRPLEQIVNTWDRHQEYQFWDVRLRDGFHWDETREIARRRLQSVGQFMAALRQGLEGADVRAES